MIIIVLIYNNLERPIDRANQQTTDPGIGVKCTMLDSLMTESVEYGLFIAVSPTCHYCNSNLSFYKILSDTIRKRGDFVEAIALVSRENYLIGENIAFRDAQININKIVAVNFNHINLSVVPGILLVDRNGTVLEYWKGKLSENNEKLLIDRITQLR